MKRYYVAVLAALCFTACSTSEIRPENERVLDEYRECWMSGDLACTKNLFTDRAWRKAGPIHEDLFARLEPGSLRWGLSYKTNREFGRTIIVSAYYGSGRVGDEALDLKGISGFYLNGEGKIRKYTPDLMYRGADPAAYVEKWPKVQRAINTYGIASTADGLTTGACLVANPGLREGNPILAPFFKLLGPVPASVGLTVGSWYIGRWTNESAYWAGEPYGTLGAYGPAALRGGAAIWNASLCF